MTRHNTPNYYNRPSSPKSPLTLGLAVLLLFLAALIIAYIIHTTLSLPVVLVSHSTSQCVRVEPARAGSCTSLPKKYDRIIIK